MSEQRTDGWLGTDRAMLWGVGAVGILIVVALLVLMLSGVIQLGGRRPDSQDSKSAVEDSWEKDNRLALTRLKSEAEALAVTGQLKEAHEKYRQLQQLVAGHTVKDAVLWELIDRAKQDQDRIYAILLARIANEPAAIQPATTPADSLPPELPQDPNPYKGFEPATAPASAPATLPIVPATAPATEPAPATKAAAPAPLVIRRIPNPDAAIDEQIGRSIQKGVNYLISHFKADELQTGKDTNRALQVGMNALCIYALLQAGQAIDDPRLSSRAEFAKGLIERLKTQAIWAESTGPQGSPVTYARSMRVAALAVHNRKEDRAVLEEDVKWLLAAHDGGAYTYDNRWGRLAPFGEGPQPGFEQTRPDVVDPKVRYYIDPEAEDRICFDGVHDKFGREIIPNLRRPGNRPDYAQTPRSRDEVRVIPWDNSNSQFGLLGVWLGAEAGMEIPDKYWQDVENHWISCQLADGQWPYSESSKEGHYAMNMAGCASLLVTHERLDWASGGRGIRPVPQALTRGLAWLENGDNCMNATAGKCVFLGYNLYGIQRVAMACGFKRFGAHDWYREMAPRVVAIQFPNGAWGRQAEGNQAIIDTAFMLLFLSRGRPPVMINKLRFDGAWAARQRDMANLTRFVSRQLERPLNWQVVAASSDWQDWTDSPILYLASSERPKLKPREIAAIRDFVNAGGLLFTHADESALAFNFFATELAQNLFPNAKLTDLPADHPIYSLVYKLTPRPVLRCVRSNSRLLMVHSPTDLSLAWQQRQETTRLTSFQLGVNLFVYAAGKTELRNRLNSFHIPAPPNPPARRLTLARLKYAGDFDPEPYAMTRFARYFQWETSLGVDVPMVQLADLKPAVAPLAHLTGSAAYNPTDAEIAAVKGYVEGGGVLLVDPCGGARELIDQIEKTLLAKAFPEGSLEPMSADHPLLARSADGMDDLSKPELRPYAAEKIGPAGGQLRILQAGEGCVIVSSLDIISGLLGTNTWQIAGYQPAYSQKLLKNAVLWAGRRAKAVP